MKRNMAVALQSGLVDFDEIASIRFDREADLIARLVCRLHLPAIGLYPPLWQLRARPSQYSSIADTDLPTSA